MVFYLPSLPTGFTIVQDFRKLPDAERILSPQMLYAIRVAQERQAWASDYLADSGASECEIIGTAHVSEDTRDVGVRLRERLGISLKTQFGWTSYLEALSAWKRATESLGMYVFQTDRIPVEQMRGCALVDKYAPVVVLNGQDQYRPRLFTLMHEITHILLGVSAISGGQQNAHEDVSSFQVETFCNAVAAETLVPMDDFAARVPKDWRRNDESVLANFAALYRVSRLVIAIRLVECGFADSSYVNNKWAMLQQKPKRRERKNVRVLPSQRALMRNGESFARLATSAYYADAIHGGQLFDLLRVKLKYLPSLEQRLY